MAAILKAVADQERTENLAQLIQRLKDEYDVNESEIARATGLASATINSWALGTRGTGRGPARKSVEALSQAYPKFSVEEILTAAGRVAPGPLSPDRKERLMDLFEKLTTEQQELQEIQIRAVVERNQQSPS